MFESALTLEISATPERVFSLLTDVDRLAAWQVEVVRADVLGGGPLVAGARVREVRRVGRRQLEQLVEVAVCEPPRRLGLRIVEGRIPIHGDWLVEGDGDGGTRLRVRAYGELPWPLRLVSAVVAPAARRQMRRQHERLRALAEAPGRPVGA